jgi:hypothetical protein
MNAPQHLSPLLAIHPSPAARALDNVRSQAAFARALVDEVERVLPHRERDLVRAQLVEELARLGCQLLDAASTLSTHLDDSRAHILRR